LENTKGGHKAEVAHADSDYMREVPEVERFNDQWGKMWKSETKTSQAAISSERFVTNNPNFHLFPCPHGLGRIFHELALVKTSH
jgi:hypothetical protein